MPFTSDKEYRALEAVLQKHFNRWVTLLHLEEWKINLTWFRSEIPDSNESVCPPGRTTLMDCTASYEYQEATIRINLEYAQQFDDAYLETVVVHELMHVILNEMRDWSSSTKGLKREERVATHLAKVVRELKGETKRERPRRVQATIEVRARPAGECLPTVDPGAHAGVSPLRGDHAVPRGRGVADRVG